MAELGIARTINLPDFPTLLGLGGELEAVRLVQYLRNFHDAVSGSYDDTAKRLNELLVEAQWASDTPAQITSGQNNYDLGTAIVHRLSTDASRTITGFLAPVIERMDVLLNVGAQDLVIANQNGCSDEANRIITGTGASVTIAADTCVLIWYDLTTARWRRLK
jgi:hypothetical protein